MFMLTKTHRVIVAQMEAANDQIRTQWLKEKECAQTNGRLASELLSERDAALSELAALRQPRAANGKFAKKERA